LYIKTVAFPSPRLGKRIDTEDWRLLLLPRRQRHATKESSLLTLGRHFRIFFSFLRTSIFFGHFCKAEEFISRMHKYINAKCKKTNMHLCKRVFHGNSSRIQNTKSEMFFCILSSTDDKTNAKGVLHWCKSVSKTKCKKTKVSTHHHGGGLLPMALRRR
jgi:hypothetical protein